MRREKREERDHDGVVFVSSTKFMFGLWFGLDRGLSIHDSRRRALRCAVFVAH